MLRYPAITKEGLKKFFSPYKELFKFDIQNKFKRDKNEKTKEVKEEQKEGKEIVDNYKNSKVNGLIKLNSLSKSFGSNNVISNINLTIPKGKIFGLVGISGSGKTTILKLIVGFYKPSKGNVFLDGKDTLKYNKEIRRSFGFGSQENCFYNGLNVQENVKYFGRLYGLTDDYINAKIDDLLRLVGLFEHKKILAEELSTGMRRRLDLACSLIHDPSIVILDEPTEDLDPALRKEVLGLIRKINKDGKTVVMTSHLLGEVESICDVVGILNQGKIIKLGSPEELKRQYTKDFEIYLQTNSRKYNSLVKNLGIKKFTKKGKGIAIYAGDGEKVLNKIVAKCKKNKDKIVSLKLARPSLSEVFEAFTKDVKK